MTLITPEDFLKRSVEDRESADYAVLYDISQKLATIATNTGVSATNSQHLTNLPNIYQKISQIVDILEDKNS